jgi:hypothetical protein
MHAHSHWQPALPFLISDPILHIYRRRNAVELEIIRVDVTYSINQDG